MDDEKKVLTVAQAAAYLNTSPSTIRRMTHQRVISSFRVNTRIRFRQSDLDEYILKTTQLSVKE